MVTYINVQGDLTGQCMCCAVQNKNSNQQLRHIMANSIGVGGQTQPWVLGTFCSKRKSNPIAGLDRPGGFQEVEVPRFQDSRHLKVVRLSAIHTGHFYPQVIFLVLISVRSWVNLRATVRPNGLCQWKVPMTPSGIEPATLQLVMQCLNQLCHPTFCSSQVKKRGKIGLNQSFIHIHPSSPLLPQFFYLPLFKPVVKKLFLRRKNIGGTMTNSMAKSQSHTTLEYYSYMY
jgi:hypothetical protein